MREAAQTSAAATPYTPADEIAAQQAMAEMEVVEARRQQTEAVQEAQRRLGTTMQDLNVKLKDIGPFLREKIEAFFKAEGIPIVVRYFDPSYQVRSRPAHGNRPIMRRTGRASLLFGVRKPCVCRMANCW